MLAFRSEAHVDRWCELRGVERGASFPLEQQWELSREWYGQRMSPDWRRRTAEEAQALFDRIGLQGDFWRMS